MNEVVINKYIKPFFKLYFVAENLPPKFALILVSLYSHRTSDNYNVTCQKSLSRAKGKSTPVTSVGPVGYGGGGGGVLSTIFFEKESNSVFGKNITI